MFLCNRYGFTREGNDISFLFTRDHPTGVFDVLTVTFGLDSTTAGPDDFIDSGVRSVTFAAGEREATVSFTTLNDEIWEAAEAVTATVLDSPGIVSNGSTATLSIDDDDAPVFSVVQIGTPTRYSGPVAIEGDTMTFQFHREGGDLSREVDVSWQFFFGTTDVALTPNVDFIGDTSGTLHFASGQMDAFLSFATIADGIAEYTGGGPDNSGLEILNLFAEGPSGLFTASGTIVDPGFAGLII